MKIDRVYCSEDLPRFARAAGIHLKRQESPIMVEPGAQSGGNLPGMQMAVRGR
jgi:hypothetical protein